jgi:hypothetical protein
MMSEIKSVRKRDRIRAKLKSLTEKDVLIAMRKTVDDGFVVFRKKLADYGIGAFKAAGGLGVASKVREKYARFDNLMKTEGEPNFESILDSVHDLAWWALTLEGMILDEVIDIDEIREDYRKYFGEEE